MKMETPATLAPPAPAGAAPAMYQQLGLLTRQLHDTMTQLGLHPKLLLVAQGLPEARSRLGYISAKTGEAADKVLNSVDQARIEQLHIGQATQRLTQAVTGPAPGAVPAGVVLDFAAEVTAASARLDGHLLDIMVAQDFHDLTGQVMGKVVSLATELEDGLLKLLLQGAPPEWAPLPESRSLAGPVVNPAGRADVVKNQGEVDELLASLGF